MNNKSLICINTCNRIAYFKIFSLDYINFCRNNSEFDFVVSLDGNNIEYIDYCKTYNIPLIYSEEREGVGLSKNRAYLTFPNYDYYFFLEDDVELINENIFQEHINYYKKTGIHHFSLAGINHFSNKINLNTDINIAHYHTGSAQFNFFTADSLKKVGGWHTKFAKFKRFGHTEHTYRIYNAGLTKAPFNSIISCFHYINERELPHVTNYSNNIVGISGLAIAEENLIKEKLNFVPFETISKFYFNNKSLSNPGCEELIENIIKGDFLEKAWQNSVIQEIDKYHFIRNEIIFINEKLNRLENELNISKENMRIIQASVTFKIGRIFSKIKKAIRK